MKDLHIIFGDENIKAWSEDDIQAIDSTSIVRKTFKTERERKLYLEALYYAENFASKEVYCCLDEDEFDYINNF